jgi:carbon monoxide dehydrogenase subunit G
MGFEIVKTFVVRSSPEQVWNFLIDPERVARCLPGAAITGKLDDKTWQGTMTVKVGPVSSSYKGKVAFEKLDPSSRTAEIVAQGQDVRGRGGADLRLTSTLAQKTPGETEVTTTSRVNITGILAQMGRGMVQDVSDQMFQIFSQRVRAELESAAPAAASAAAPGAPAALVPAAAPSKPEALDVGALGARAVLRAPVFWVAVAAAAVLVYLLLR